MSYRLIVEHDGNYSDEELEECVGKKSSGAGTDLITNTRDVEWTYRSLPNALYGFNRLTTKKKLTKLALEKQL